MSKLKLIRGGGLCLAFRVTKGVCQVDDHAKIKRLVQSGVAMGEAARAWLDQDRFG